LRINKNNETSAVQVAYDEQDRIQKIINETYDGNKRSVIFEAVSSLYANNKRESDRVISDNQANRPFYLYIDNEDPVLDNRISEGTQSLSTFLSNIVFITTREDDLNEILSHQNDFLTFIMLLRYRRIRELVEKNKEESRKSAKAAIMSRNMSHNLGSHVMSYLKHDLQSIPTIFSNDSDVLKDLLPKLLENPDKAKEILLEEHIEMPFLLGLGRFIGYLQERQDYIATVSTDYIPHESPVNFKEAVYDELNPDLRYERHKGESSVYKPKNILLDFIAKSEGYARKDGNLKIGFIWYDDNGTSSVSWGGKECEDKAFDLMRKYDINLPGGLVGRQAIFSIMENIIRNSAKHSDREKENTKLEFVFDIIDGTDLGGGEVEIVNSRFASRIHDSDLRKIFISSSDVNNLYIVSVTTNQKVDNGTISFIRKALNQDIIMSAGRMREENKGISEMRISATWLRHFSAETKTSALNENGEVMNSGGLAPILSVELTDGGMLRYFFCVSKSLELLVIDDKQESSAIGFNILKARASESIGWKRVDEDKISEFDKSASFIVVVDDDAYKRLRPRLSNRIVIWKETSSIDEYSTNDDFLKWICKLHTQISDSEQLYIWDEKTYNNNRDKTIFQGIKCYPAEIVDGDTDYRKYVKYAYRTHHSSEHEFVSYLERRFDYNPQICIDAITGDNASDRLVRRGVLDERWYCSHIYALKKKVAIFDERMFNMYYNVDESSFFKGVPIVDDFIKQIENKQFIWDFQDELSVLCKKLQEQNLPEAAHELSEAMIKEEVLTILNKHLFIYENQSNTQIKSIFYHEKMIDFFTLIQDRENARQFFIMGLISHHIKDRNCIYGKVGIILIDQDNQIHITLSDSIKHRFDYISIHQGLLDKVYAWFDKDGLKEKQIELTNLINSEFNTTPRAIGEDGYLENFFIHSGRSKPAEKDMPQKLPFIQYSAIENAVEDCKYSLVELFDYARY